MLLGRIHGVFMTLATLISLVLSGCVYDSISPCESDDIYTHDGKVLLVMHIAPISTRGSAIGQDDEKINSLRIVILDLDENQIECNHFTNLANSAVSSNVFPYQFVWPTTSGNKKIFVFANEESVGNISYQPSPDATWTDDLPINTLPSSLTELFNLDDLKGGEGLATVFQEVIGSVYFTPVYTPHGVDPENGISGYVLLPYSTKTEEFNAYPGMGWDGSEQSVTPNVYLHLIPVATKFTFNFTNEREVPIYIRNLSASNFDTQNFLMADVGYTDYYKTLNGQETYWVNWLATVSALSHEYIPSGKNEGFNEIYGWLTDYKVPQTSNPKNVNFLQMLYSAISGNDGNSGSSSTMTDGIWNTIPPSDDVKGSLTLGPFYVPESLNLVTFTKPSPDNPDETQQVTEQQYFLSINLFDDDGQGPYFDNNPITNLGALFRNTSVIINVNVTGKSIEIYAQIEDWKEKSASGWVIEGK